MSSVKASYEEWVRREQKWLLPLLDTARNLTLFLPGRFSDTELRSEASQTPPHTPNHTPLHTPHMALTQLN